jgi:hypothetical protein
MACAVGWSTGLWAVPLIAYGLLEATWTLAERAGSLRREFPRGLLRKVEVERVQ